MNRRHATDWVDPIVKGIAQRINGELGARGWTKKYLADRVGWPRESLSKYLNGSQTRLPFELVLKIARVFDTTIEDLAGQRRPEHGSTFDPCHQVPKVLLDKFSEHEKPRIRFIAFDRYVAYPRMTADVQSKFHLSRFAALTGKQEGVDLIERWDEWGNTRRERYLQQSAGDLPSIESIMLRSDLEKMVSRAPPFEFCTVEEIGSFFDYLRRCVEERGFRLLLLDDRCLANHPELQFRLTGLEAVGIVGSNFAFRKYGNTTVSWSERRVEVNEVVCILKRLAQLACASSENDVTAALVQFQRAIDKQWGADGPREKIGTLNDKPVDVRKRPK
jgi:transcriptional regulator with XRE-family HTH domain